MNKYWSYCSSARLKHVFSQISDQYIDKEDNNRVKDVLLSFLTSDDVKLNKIDAEDPEVSL